MKFYFLTASIAALRHIQLSIILLFALEIVLALALALVLGLVLGLETHPSAMDPSRG